MWDKAAEIYSFFHHYYYFFQCVYVAEKRERKILWRNTNTVCKAHSCLADNKACIVIDNQQGSQAKHRVCFICCFDNKPLGLCDAFVSAGTSRRPHM
jgi:hypothetical protein